MVVAGWGAGGAALAMRGMRGRDRVRRPAVRVIPVKKRHESGGENRSQGERDEQPKAAPTSLPALMFSAAPPLCVHSILQPAPGPVCPGLYGSERRRFGLAIRAA